MATLIVAFKSYNERLTELVFATSLVEWLATAYLMVGKTKAKKAKQYLGYCEGICKGYSANKCGKHGVIIVLVSDIIY